MTSEPVFRMVMRCVCAAMLAVGAVDALAAESAEAPVAELSDQRGLCLVIGSGGPAGATLLSTLAKEDRFVVYGYAADRAACDAAREAIYEQGWQKQVKLDVLPSGQLPWPRDYVNAVVIGKVGLLKQHGIARSELERIVTPGGVIVTPQDGTWNVWSKPRPDGMDVWTHPDRAADGNTASSDQVFDVPAFLRWQSGTGKASGLGSSKTLLVDERRLYAMSGDGGRTRILCLDAYNGVPCWTHPYNAGKRGPYWHHPMASGTDALYTPCSTGGVDVIEAATGRVREVLSTPYPRIGAILVTPERVVVASWKQLFDQRSLLGSLRGGTINPSGVGAVTAYARRDGTKLWEHPLCARYDMMSSHGTLYMLAHTGPETPPEFNRFKSPPMRSQAVVALDLKTGEERWRHNIGASWDTRLLFSCEAGVAVIRAYGWWGVLSATDGTPLWKHPVKKIGRTTRAALCGKTVVFGQSQYGLMDGKSLARHGLLHGAPKVGNNMCAPLSMIDGRFIFLSRRGQVRRLTRDPDSDAMHGAESSPLGLRSMCEVGLVFGNGQVYAPSIACACVPAQVPGYVALGPYPEGTSETPQRTLEQGPAYGVGGTTQEGGWPQAGANACRTASVNATLADKLAVRWTKKVCSPAQEGVWLESWKEQPGGYRALSAPVCDASRAYVAAREDGVVHCLDLASGNILWTHQTGSRISGAPGLTDGLCIVGSHDGTVTALRCTDGALAWQLHVAPGRRQLVSWSQVESAWPVHAVAIHDGVIYAVAGRTTHLDGIWLVAIAADTGRVVAEQLIKGDAFDIRCIRPGQKRKRGDKRGSGHLAAAPYLTPKGVRVSDSLVPLSGVTWQLPDWMQKGGGCRNAEIIVAWNQVEAVSPPGDAAAPSGSAPLLKLNPREIVARALVKTHSETTPHALLLITRTHKGAFLKIARGSTTAFGKPQLVATLPGHVVNNGLAVSSNGTILVSHIDGRLSAIR